MPFISKLGDNGAIWIIIALVFVAVRKFRHAGIMMLVALLIGLLVGNVFLKPLIARLRPCDLNKSIVLLVPRPKDYSFPSGHTLSSFAAATVIFLNKRRIGLVALALALIIAFSRLYLYVHFLSDILGGIAVGMAVGILTVILFRKLSEGRFS